jgi:hypothetical protein
MLQVGFETTIPVSEWSKIVSLGLREHCRRPIWNLLNSGNCYYQSVQNLFIYRQLYSNVEIKTQKHNFVWSFVWVTAKFTLVYKMFRWLPINDCNMNKMTAETNFLLL